MHFGIESTANTSAAKIWNKIHKETKEASTFQVFKSKIKKWIPQGCPCSLQNIRAIPLKSVPSRP